jgi:hypothetical protein
MKLFLKEKQRARCCGKLVSNIAGTNARIAFGLCPADDGSMVVGIGAPAQWRFNFNGTVVLLVALTWLRDDLERP